MTGSGPRADCPTSENFDWDVYYKASGGRDVRPLLVQAVEAQHSAGDALELGAGAGNEVRYLLERFDQPVIHMGPADYTSWARKTWEAERATIDRLGLRNSL